MTWKHDDLLKLLPKVEVLLLMFDMKSLLKDNIADIVKTTQLLHDEYSTFDGWTLMHFKGRSEESWNPLQRKHFIVNPRKKTIKN